MQKSFSNFNNGVVDKSVIADAKYKDSCLFLDSSNYIISPNNTLKKRYGTRRITERTTYSRFFPFIRGDNEKYMLELKENAQKIWAVMSDGALVEAFINDQSGQTELPLPFESNTGIGYTILRTLIDNGAIVSDSVQPADLYKVFNEEYNIGANKGIRLNITTVLSPLNKIKLLGKLNSFTAIATGDSGVKYKKVIDKGRIAATMYNIADDIPTAVWQRIIRRNSGVKVRKGYVYKYVNEFEFDFAEINEQIKKIDIYPNSATNKLWFYGQEGDFWINNNKQYISKVLVDYTGVDENALAEFTEEMTLEQIKSADISATADWICITHNDFMPKLVSVRNIFDIDDYAPNFGSDWNFNTLGFPGKSLFAQGRLWFSNLFLSKNTILGSTVGYNLTAIQNLNPQSGSDGQLLPTSAVRFDPYEITGKVNFLCGTHTINFGHTLGLSKVAYGNGQAISVNGTPSIISDNSYGSGAIAPALIGSSIVYTNFKKDCLFSANYTIASATQGFKESTNLTKIHSELLASGILDLTFTNDLNANLYCTTNERCICFDAKNIFGAFPIDISGNAILETFVLQNQDASNLVYFYTITQDNKYELLCMQDGNEFMDSAESFKTKIDVDADIPVGNLRIDIPSGFTSAFLVQYPVWFELTYFPNIEDYVNDVIIFNSSKDRFTIHTATNGGGDTIYFGVPDNASSDVWGQEIEWNGETYPYVGNDYYICTNVLSGLLPSYEYVIRHQNGYLYITSDDNGDLSLGNYYGNFVYGLTLSAYCEIANLCQNYNISKRKINYIDLNTFNSYFTYCGTNEFDTSSELGFYVGSIDVSPMPYWVRHKMEDNYEDGMKVFIVADKSPYHSEILNIVVDFDENMIS